MKKYLPLKKPDYALSLLIFGLVVFGLVMISSASSVISYERFGRSDYYLIRQLVSFGIGILFWIIFQGIDYHIFKKYAGVLLITTILLLVLVFVPGIGHAWRGVHRWIGIGSFVFQPSEIIKLTLILYLAAWFEKRKEKIKTFFKGFMPFAALIGILVGLLAFQPDIGTMAVIAGTATTMYFLAGSAISHLAIGGVFASIIFWILIKLAPYRMARILAFVNPENDPLGIAYHIRNALIAIGSGGLLGLGFGMSRQKHLFLPEAHTDSIFAVIAEELGLLRTILLVAAFAYLAYKGYKIASRTQDEFGRLIASGITTWFIFQAFINIAGISGLLPFTGVPLPFISYGGTALVTTLAGVGILLNISKYRK